MTQQTTYEDARLRPFHLRVAIAGTGGQFSDGFELGIVGIVLMTASTALQLNPLWTGLLAAATLSGLFLGAVVTGPIADRIGRRPIFAWDMLVFGIVSAAQFLVQEPWQLLLLRLVLGLMLGADYVVSKSLVTEHSPRRYRGRLLSALAVAWTAGYASAYLAGYALSGLGPDAWRWMLVVSAVPALLVFGFRVGIPESPLWLARHGRTAKAADVVHRFLGANTSPPVAATDVPHRGPRVLFTPVYRRRSAVAALFYMCQVIPYFALGTFSSQVMKGLGVTGALTAGAVYNVFLIAGAVLGLLVIDRLSRRFFLISTFFSGATLLLALVLLAHLDTRLTVALFALFALVLAAAANLEFNYPPELFPTDVRASGVALAVAASRIGAAISTFLLPVVVTRYGVDAALFACVTVLVIGGIICAVWAPETAKTHLGDVSGAKRPIGHL